MTSANSQGWLVKTSALLAAKIPTHGKWSLQLNTEFLASIERIATVCFERGAIVHSAMCEEYTACAQRPCAEEAKSARLDALRCRNTRLKSSKAGHEELAKMSHYLRCSASAHSAHGPSSFELGRCRTRRVIPSRPAVW